MEQPFAFLNLDFFTRASVYPGSLGTFRYRFQRSGWIGDGTIQAWVYENVSFELENGRQLALKGGNGCGKSSILKKILGGMLHTHVLASLSLSLSLSLSHTHTNTHRAHKHRCAHE